MRREYPPHFEGAAATVRSISPFYSLMDVGSGNSLGTYDSLEEGTEAVVTLLEAFGSEYADDLDLGRDDEQGNWEHVATGDALLHLVGFATQPQVR